MMDILPDLRTAKEFVDKATSTSNTFVGSTASSILTAMTSGTRAVSISTSGKASNDIRLVLGELNRKGYKASLSGTNTLEVSW